MPKYLNNTNTDKMFYGYRLTPGVITNLMEQYDNDGTDVIRVEEAPVWNPVILSELITTDIRISIPEKMTNVGESEAEVQNFAIKVTGDDGVFNASNYATVDFNSKEVGVIDEDVTAAIAAPDTLANNPVKAQVTTVKLYSIAPALVDTLVYSSGTITETLDGPSTDATATININTGALDIVEGTSGAVTATASYTYHGVTSIPSLKVFNKDSYKFACKTPRVLRDLIIKIAGTFKVKVDILLNG